MGGGAYPRENVAKRRSILAMGVGAIGEPKTRNERYFFGSGDFFGSIFRHERASRERGAMGLRPGSLLSRKLFSSCDAKRFKSALAEYASRVVAHSKTAKGASKLVEDDTWWRKELPDQIRSAKKISKADLERLMRWKLARGKFRPALTALIKRNSAASVEAHSADAFKEMGRGELRPAIVCLTRLSGVGPATASAVLAAGWPDIAPFMADEAMEADPELGQRKYTLRHYMDFADSMKQVADTLGDDWTPELVGRALWSESHPPASTKAPAGKRKAAAGRGDGPARKKRGRQ